MVGGGRVDGSSRAGAPHDPRIAYLSAADCPFAVSGRSGEGESSDFPHIDIDNQAGTANKSISSRSATAHWVDFAARRNGVYGRRHEGYRCALAQAVCLSQRIGTDGDLLPDGGYQAAHAR